jgi:hypothetical protein
VRYGPSDFPIIRNVSGIIWRRADLVAIRRSPVRLECLAPGHDCRSLSYSTEMALRGARNLRAKRRFSERPAHCWRMAGSIQ